DPAIHQWQLSLEGLEVAAVGVPAANGESYAADAGFHEPPRHQELLDALVAVASARLLAGQVERVADGARGHHVERPRRERVHAADAAAGINVATNAVEVAQQGLAVVVAAMVDAGRQSQILHAGAVGGKGPMARPKVARLQAAAQPTQADVRRNVGMRAA